MDWAGREGREGAGTEEVGLAVEGLVAARREERGRTEAGLEAACPAEGSCQAAGWLRVVPSGVVCPVEVVVGEAAVLPAMTAEAAGQMEVLCRVVETALAVERSRVVGRGKTGLLGVGWAARARAVAGAARKESLCRAAERRTVVGSEEASLGVGVCRGAGRSVVAQTAVAVRGEGPCQEVEQLWVGAAQGWKEVAGAAMGVLGSREAEELCPGRWEAAGEPLLQGAGPAGEVGRAARAAGWEVEELGEGSVGEASAAGLAAEGAQMSR